MPQDRQIIVSRNVKNKHFWFRWFWGPKNCGAPRSCASCVYGSQGIENNNNHHNVRCQFISRPPVFDANFCWWYVKWYPVDSKQNAPLVFIKRKNGVQQSVHRSSKIIKYVRKLLRNDFIFLPFTSPHYFSLALIAVFFFCINATLTKKPTIERHKNTNKLNTIHCVDDGVCVYVCVDEIMGTQKNTHFPSEILWTMIKNKYAFGSVSGWLQIFLRMEIYFFFACENAKSEKKYVRV